MIPENNLLPKRYIPRDLSWMYFNHRVLQEATKQSLPILERVSFLGIYANNLDEFYRVRIATQRRIADSLSKKKREERNAAIHILHKIQEADEVFRKQHEDAFRQVKEELRKENIFILNETELNEEQKGYLRTFYHDSLYAHLFPLKLSKVDSLRSLDDSFVYLAITLLKKDEYIPSKKKKHLVIKLPTDKFSRVVRLSSSEGKTYLMFLDDIVRYCLPFVFPDDTYEVLATYSFRFAKDAEMDMDANPQRALMDRVLEGVNSRKKGVPLRLDHEADMPGELLNQLEEKLQIDENDVYPSFGRYLNLKGLMKFPNCKRPDLKYPLWPPITIPEAQLGTILPQIRERDRFFHFPYHNFSSFIHLLQEAAISDDVKSIKITMYRLTRNSRVVEALMSAAANGKSVTVFIELLARFDELSNIRWSKIMQDAGIKVVFGNEGLKVHAKLMYITSKKGNIACISTGNFHEVNAKVYTDVCYLTADKRVTKEVGQVFNFIEKPYVIPTADHLLFAPHALRQKLYDLIDVEIENAKEGKEAYILAKLNHITDGEMVRKLYEASMAGVKINLLIRGNCSLVTGEKFSENIKVVGIIDRFLEHSRIIFFCNGGEEQCFVGSADWMSRNLNKRVEVMAPVYDEDVRSEFKRIIEYGFQDTVQGRIVDGSGENVFQTDADRPPFRSQEALYNHYKAQH